MAIKNFWIGMEQKLNKRNDDGSVNSFYETKQPAHGYYVPFFDVRFESQIEDGILPTVMLLNTHNLKTVTSCHGHSFLDYVRGGIRYNVGPHITFIVVTEYKNEIKKLFSNFFIVATDNNTIDGSADHVRLRPRWYVRHLIPNKILCKMIYDVCRKALK